MNLFRLSIHFIAWWLKAINRHGAHGPFLYGFLDKCLYRKSNTSAFDDIEKIRGELKRNHRTLTYKDLGAGQRKYQKNNITNPELINRDTKDIAHNSLQSPKYCRLYYRIIQYFNYQSVLELGTSLGITTSYLALANPRATIETIEGVRVVAGIAEEVFQKNNLDNIKLHVGDFNDVLNQIPENKKYDMIILDGNHRGNATMDYFLWSIKHIHEHGVLIVDDIRWSQSMFHTWKNIINHDEVKLSIDLFYMGLVFFNKNLSKENYKVRF